MKRRTFVRAIGAGSVGAGALVGTGSYSRIKSQRRVKIEVEDDEETAWSILLENENPDPEENRINEIEDINTNRWGWYMPYTLGDFAEAEFWAAAGNNNLDNGTLVGNVTIDVENDILLVTINMVNATLLEANLYVDRDTDRLRDTNAATGQLGFADTDDEFDDGTFSIPLSAIESEPEFGDDIVLALHGKVVSET